MNGQTLIKVGTKGRLKDVFKDEFSVHNGHAFGVSFFANEDQKSELEKLIAESGSSAEPKYFLATDCLCIKTVDENSKSGLFSSEGVGTLKDAKDDAIFKGRAFKHKYDRNEYIYTIQLYPEGIPYLHLSAKFDEQGKYSGYDVLGRSQHRHSKDEDYVIHDEISTFSVAPEPSAA